MDESFFKDLLEIDSTSGRERVLSEWLARTLAGFAPHMELSEVGDGTQNLLLSWGTPRLVYCTHMDTVPPYIPPTFEQDRVLGRGSCDAKGQIMAILGAAGKLSDSGRTDFGVLLLSGEETGSFGAKAFARTAFKAPYLVIGEPTGGRLVSAAKGTKSFDVTFEGEAFHSGYPQYGRSAVNMFLDFMQELKEACFEDDPLLGQTTCNVGELYSPNPQNILSPALSCRVYMRTTFASDNQVTGFMSRQRPHISVTARGGDAPAHYFTIPGIETCTVAFGSDAPHLTGFEHKMICGPGSILVAHRDDEQILKADIEKAVETYIKIYEALQ